MEIQKLVLKFEKELLEEKDKIVKEKEAIEVKELTKNAFSNADYNILLEKDMDEILNICTGLKIDVTKEELGKNIKILKNKDIIMASDFKYAVLESKKYIEELYKKIIDSFSNDVNYEKEKLEVEKRILIIDDIIAKIKDGKLEGKFNISICNLLISNMVNLSIEEKKALLKLILSANILFNKKSHEQIEATNSNENIINIEKNAEVLETLDIIPTIENSDIEKVDNPNKDLIDEADAFDIILTNEKQDKLDEIESYLKRVKRIINLKKISKATLEEYFRGSYSLSYIFENIYTDDESKISFLVCACEEILNRILDTISQCDDKSIANMFKAEINKQYDDLIDLCNCIKTNYIKEKSGQEEENLTNGKYIVEKTVKRELLYTKEAQKDLKSIKDGSLNHVRKILRKLENPDLSENDGILINDIYNKFDSKYTISYRKIGNKVLVVSVIDMAEKLYTKKDIIRDRMDSIDNVTRKIKENGEEYRAILEESRRITNNIMNDTEEQISITDDTNAIGHVK